MLSSIYKQLKVGMCLFEILYDFISSIQLQKRRKNPKILTKTNIHRNGSVKT